MDVGTAVGISSMILALLALFVAIVQVNIQASIEARRKGKTDKLALGDWAITWPQARNLAFEICSVLRIRSPFGDPKILTVPFITVGALEDCLRSEAIGERRGLIERRMKDRLVESATSSIATGSGRFTGRMYAVRNTTRKRSEACWSDAMNMCGITRQYWPLMTGASALACDGAIRPANAVTNLHSLGGFARAMGLRSIEIQGTRITMTNGGASIYLDQYAGVDRPTKLAHFSGSPNGRYNILEEMSQQTAASIYADAVWSDGCVPNPLRLETKFPDGTAKDIGRRHVAWPSYINPPTLNCNEALSEEKFSSWAVDFLDTYTQQCHQSLPSEVSYIHLVQANESAVISCIRTYPKSNLSTEQIQAYDTALVWCINHWWRDPYQAQNFNQHQQEATNAPRLPLPDINQISSEFITSRSQALLWCQTVKSRKAVAVEPECWANCLRYAKLLSEKQAQDPRPILRHVDYVALLKVLQGWKLHTFCSKLHKDGSSVNHLATGASATTSCEILLLSMALLSMAMDSSEMGSSEVNKAVEIELG
jgi:hypothetical protein